MGKIEERFSKYVRIKEHEYEEIASCLVTLQNLTEEYRHCYDLMELERIKREFNSFLQRLTTLYPLTKRYKGSNHTYLEDAIKRLKAETIDILMNSVDAKKSVTQAERVLYDYPYYVKERKIIDDLIGQLIKVEELHDNFNITLQSIVQSIAVLSKEYSNSKSVS